MRERGGKTQEQWHRRVIAALGLMICFFVCLGAPGQQPNRSAPEPGGNKSKEMPERAIELLVTPVAWNSVSASYQSTASYKQGDPVFFELVMKSQMPQPTDIDMSVGNHLFQWRPRLVKDGWRVPTEKERTRSLINWIMRLSPSMAAGLSTGSNPRRRNV